MTKLSLQETVVGNRLICKCGGEQFFITDETDAVFDGKVAIVDNIECTKCHKMFTVHIKIDKELTYSAHTTDPNF